MILILHILIAILSVIYAGFMAYKPAKQKLYLTYLLTALTIASGTYLIIIKPSHMMQSCVTGMVYLFVVISFIILANKRLPASS